jgi:hypothetical protein
MERLNKAYFKKEVSMKKLLLIGMLTVAGALNLHAAESNNQSAWQAKQKTLEVAFAQADAIQDKYQKLINDTLKKYGNHSNFIKGYISGFQYNQNNTPEQAVEDAKKQVKEAKKQYNQALENVTLFTKFSKNSEVTRLMTEIITISSTLKPDPTSAFLNIIPEATQKQLKSLEDSMDAIIGKDNYGMRNLLDNHFTKEYIKKLNVSNEDIQAVQALQKERNDAISQLNSQPRQLQVEH